ncbi:MAG: hypothetical protein LBE02_02575 [Spirochaetaceae bacterium]|nr:hypothetical protein [Spirochaetaceae bacterium]
MEKEIAALMGNGVAALRRHYLYPGDRPCTGGVRGPGKSRTRPGKGFSRPGQGCHQGGGQDGQTELSGTPATLEPNK